MLKDMRAGKPLLQEILPPYTTFRGRYSCGTRLWKGQVRCASEPVQQARGVDRDRDARGHYNALVLCTATNTYHSTGSYSEPSWILYLPLFTTHWRISSTMQRTYLPPSLAACASNNPG